MRRDSEQTRKHLPLARLLAAHREAPGLGATLAECLGDAALYQANHVYRQLRDAALARGCRYVLDDSEGYFAWPLAALTRLLETRTIPYRRSYRSFASLDATRPGFFTTEHTELVEPQVNVLLHESAHCVADALWAELQPPLAALIPAQRTVLRYAFGEAFANASEVIAMAVTRTPEDRWLLGLNSYWAFVPRVPRAWADLSTATSPRIAARWLVLCFLASNLCRSTLAPDERRTLLQSAGMPAHAPEGAIALFLDESLSLNLDFRLNTAALFYASLGLDPDPRKITQFAFHKAVATDPKVSSFLDRLADLLILS